MAKVAPSRQRRGWLDNLKETIPGYIGYAEKEHRRTTDQLQREYLANQLGQLVPSINELIHELTGSGRVLEALPLTRVMEGLKKLQTRLRRTGYASTLFFRDDQIPEPQLDQMYQFDLVLLQQTDDLKRRVQKFKTNRSQAELLKAGEELEAAIEALSSEFEVRADTIKAYR